jgi:type IV secretory pathway VirB10-like protein
LSKLERASIACRWPHGRLAVACCAVALALAAAGCAKTQAKTVPDGPPLEVPAPPPRVIAPIDEPLAATPAEPAEPAPAPASTTRRPVRRAPAATDVPQRTEQPPAVETGPPQAAPEPVAPAAPPATLRAPGTAEKPVRDRLGVAQRDLGRVDYSKLSEDGRAQYEQSKRFIQQAEQALKDQNIVFAQTLADKAATLAAELLGR